MVLKTADTSSLWSDFNKIAAANPSSQSPPSLKTVPSLNQHASDANRIFDQYRNYDYSQPTQIKYIPAPTLQSIAVDAAKVTGAIAGPYVPPMPKYVPIDAATVLKDITTALPVVMGDLAALGSSGSSVPRVSTSSAAVTSGEMKVLSPAVIASVQSDLNVLQASNPYQPSSQQAVKYVADVAEIRAVLDRIVADPGRIPVELPKVRDVFQTSTAFLDQIITGESKPAVSSDAVSSLKTIPSSVSELDNKLKAVISELKASSTPLSDNITILSSGLKVVSDLGINRMASDMTQIERSVPTHTSDGRTLKVLTSQAIANLEKFFTDLNKPAPEQKLRIMMAAPDPNKPPESAAEITLAARTALDKWYPAGKTNDDNRLISIYYPALAGLVINGQIDGNKLADNIRLYIAAEQGGAKEIQSTDFHIQNRGDVNQNSRAFNELTLQQQQDRLALVYKQAIADGLGPVVAAVSTRNLIERGTDGATRDTLMKWAEGTGLNDAVMSDRSFTTREAVKEWAGTMEGQMVIGATITAVGALVVAATGGAVLAAGGLMAGVFALTELPQAMSFAKNMKRDELKALGIYAPDREFNYEQAASSTRKLLDNLTFQPEKLDASTRQLMLEESNKSYDALGKELSENWAFLQTQGSYNQKLKEYKDLGAQLRMLNDKISVDTGAMLTEAAAPSNITIVPPKGGRIESDEWTGGSDQEWKITEIGYEKKSYKVFDKYGNLVSTETVDVGPGRTGTYDHSQELAFPSIKEEQAAAEPSKIRPVTLYVGPGQTAEMLGKVYTGGEEGTSYLVQAPVGTQASITYRKEGSVSDILNTLVQDEPTQFWYKELQPSYVATPKLDYATLAPKIKEGQQLFIDGKEIVNPERLALMDVEPGLHSVVIKEAGKEDYVTTVNAFAGTKTSIAGQGKDPFVPYVSQSSGGSGGGGYSGGGSYSSTPAETKIIFGNTLTGAQVFLDAVELQPVIGTAYAVTAGYHALLAKMAGKADYSKQVYVGQGDTVEVNAVWATSDGVVTTTEKTQILFGPSLEGARIWLDNVEVAPVIDQAYATTVGYHSVIATKPGYKDWVKTVYVSSNTTLNVDAALEPVIEPVIKSTVAKITFGESVTGAQVYVNEILLDVAPGMVFEYPEGYHGVKLTKAGYYDWLKTVFLAAGDTLTVSPVFEPKPVPVEDPQEDAGQTTKRVYINSQPFGAKILINGGFTGQWTPAYLDLERGLYELVTQKTDYEDYKTYVWVGDTIAFGDTAVALAQLAAGGN